MIEYFLHYKQKFSWFFMYICIYYCIIIITTYTTAVLVFKCMCSVQNKHTLSFKPQKFSTTFQYTILPRVCQNKLNSPDAGTPKNPYLISWPGLEDILHFPCKIYGSIRIQRASIALNCYF